MILHILIALAFQLLGRVTLGSWIAGAALASAWAISREITQADYRWIEWFGDGRRANMPWWGGFDPRVWTYLDRWLDWLVPCLAVTLAALFARWSRGS